MGLTTRDRRIKQEVTRYALQLERQLHRNADVTDRLERYSGKAARLFDSQHPRGWEGLEGTIMGATSSHPQTPFVLSYHDLFDNRWLENYIYPNKIRSIKKKGRMIYIDTEWVHGSQAPRYY